MLNPFATPQIFLTGRIINAIGFDSSDLFIKYSFIISDDFTLLNGSLSGETFQSTSAGSKIETTNVINFDHPLYFNLKCQCIKGWPKILLEIYSNDEDGRNNLIGYGTGFIPVKKGTSHVVINCWRPTDSVGRNLSETFLKNNAEFLDTSAIYTTEEKFGVCGISTGQVNLELEIIFKDFNLHGIEI